MLNHELTEINQNVWTLVSALKKQHIMRPSKETAEKQSPWQSGKSYKVCIPANHNEPLSTNGKKKTGTVTKLLKFNKISPRAHQQLI